MKHSGKKFSSFTITSWPERTDDDLEDLEDLGDDLEEDLWDRDNDFVGLTEGTAVRERYLVQT